MAFRRIFTDPQKPPAKIAYIYLVGCSIGIFVAAEALRFFELPAALTIKTSVLTGLLIFALSACLFRRRSRQSAAERLSAILEHAPVGIVVGDLSGHVLESNAALQRMLGYSAGELAGRLFADYTHPDDLPRNLELRQQLRDGKLESYDMEKRYLRKDGSVIWGRAVASKLGNGLVLSIIEETTAQKGAEQQLCDTAKRLQAILQHAPIGIVISDRKGRLIESNVAYQRMRGCSAEEAKETYFAQYTHPDDLSTNLQLFNQMVRGELPFFEIEKRNIREDGQITWARAIVSRLSEDTNIGIVEDITARKQTEHRLEIEVAERARAEEQLTRANIELKNRADELERQAGEMQLFRRLGSGLRACADSPEAEAVIGKVLMSAFPHCSGAVYTMNNSRNLLHPTNSWGARADFRPFAPDDCCALRLGHVHVADGTQLVDCAHARHPEQKFYVCAPLIAQGELLGTIFIQAKSLSDLGNVELVSDAPKLLQAIAERSSIALAGLKLRQELREAAIRDPLTGLFNRRYMEETLPRELARCARNNMPLTVLMADIDHFKSFNDEHGHDAGDLVLKQTGLLLKSFLRAEDIVCRIGGEEFLVILPGLDLECSIRRANELRVQFGSMRVSHRGVVMAPVTLSIGIANTAENGTSMDELLLAADHHLYAAKNSGRNNVCYSFPPSLSNAGRFTTHESALIRQVPELPPHSRNISAD